MDRPIRVTLTCNLDREALDALRLMAPGPKRLGAFISQLIHMEAMRRQVRHEERERYEQMLREAPALAGSNG